MYIDLLKVLKSFVVKEGGKYCLFVFLKFIDLILFLGDFY